MTKAEQLLKDLAEALDGAFISTWQTTSAWQKELDAAMEYVKDIDHNSCFSIETQQKLDDALTLAKHIGDKYSKDRK